MGADGAARCKWARARALELVAQPRRLSYLSPLPTEKKMAATVNLCQISGASGLRHSTWATDRQALPWYDVHSYQGRSFFALAYSGVPPVFRAAARRCFSFLVSMQYVAGIGRRFFLGSAMNTTLNVAIETARAIQDLPCSDERIEGIARVLAAAILRLDAGMRAGDMPIDWVDAIDWMGKKQ